MPTPTEELVDLLDGRFKIRVQRAGAGDPVVYLHGAGGAGWDAFLDHLASSHEVIAPEHPGAGESQGLEHVEDLWDLVLYYGELLDHLGLPRVSVVGHSFGGMVAAELAATSPERVAKLVLLAPIGLWRDDHPIPDISTILPQDLPSLVLADPDGPMAAALPSPDPGDPEALYRAGLTMASINQFIWPLPDKGLRKRLYRVRADTLLIWGAEDRLVPPAYGEDFAAAIAGARLELVPGAGHLPQLEQPQRVQALVDGFLA